MNNSKQSTAAQSSPLARKQRTKKMMFMQVVLFFSVFYLVTLAAWIMPLRPSFSEVEKRELTRFPSFQWSALADGSYFDAINTWFADTFPFREGLITANGRLQSLYGFAGAQVHGNVEQGDDIPDAPPVPGDLDPSQAGSTVAADGKEGSSTAESDAEPSLPEVEEENLDGVDTQTMGAVLIVGDKAYEYYNFVQNTADQYAAAVNKTASLLAGRANVYDMIIPTSMDITLPASVRQGITNTSDQKKAIDYMRASMSEQVRSVEIFDTLRARRDEYIYFRTDHHWTSLGAYYAYEQFAAAKGIEPSPLEEYTKVEYPNFIGSFYGETQKNPNLASNPDVVTAYIPQDTNKITVTNQKGQTSEGNIITNVSTWAASSKYSTFIAGDNPYSVIVNDAVADDSACVVVKESFGNAFVPFLVSHYHTVHIIDYRYFAKVKQQSLPDFVQGLDSQNVDVLFLNNISATRNKNLMKTLNNLVG